MSSSAPSPRWTPAHSAQALLVFGWVLDRAPVDMFEPLSSLNVAVVATYFERGYNPFSTSPTQPCATVSLLSVAAALPITGEFMAAVSALGSVDPTSLAVQYLLFRAATFLPLVRFKDRDGVSDRTRDEVAALLLAFPLALSALSQLSWGAAGVYWALRQFQFIGADVAQLVTYGAYHSFLSVQCYIFAGAELFEHGCTNCQGMVKRLALPCVVNFGGAACVACVARGTNYIGTCSYAMPVLRAEPVVNREVLEEDEGNNAAVPVDEGNNAAVPVDESVGGGY